MGRFGGLAGVRANNGGIYFEEGNYVVDIGAIKFIPGTEAQSGLDTFVVETTVAESDNPTRSPGTRPSYVVTIRPAYRETCLGDIKAFAAAILEIDDPDAYNEQVTAVDQVNATQMGCSVQDAANERFWEESLEALCSAEQPARGTRVKLNCTKRKTKKGGDFTKHCWGPVVHTTTPAA